MAGLKLQYFDLRCRGEVLRYMLVNAEKEFTDERIPLPPAEDWAKIKPTTPWGQVPVLHIPVEGTETPVEVGQSGALARYIAKETGHFGSSPVEGALIDSVNEYMQDIYKAGYADIIIPEAFQNIRLEEERKEFIEKKAPELYSRLEKFLSKNNEGDGFFVGNKVSLADFQFYSFTEVLKENISQDLLKNFPKLQQLYTRVQTLPKIALYLKSRPHTPF